ncbi:MAG: TonB-dependent receptor plug domain-containing protein [Sphingomonadales bacterium]|nr:TonB-dependent receptor plug domain-containing protein [Sphingomonadales bacterium]
MPRGTNRLSAANLRGRCGNNTVVLLNGRRVATPGSPVRRSTSPDPLRRHQDRGAEDSASAIYGTDAIGGLSTSSPSPTTGASRSTALSDATEGDSRSTAYREPWAIAISTRTGSTSRRRSRRWNLECCALTARIAVS